MAKAHSRDTKLYLDGVDLSGAGASVDVETEGELSEATAFADQGQVDVRGVARDNITADVLFDNSGADAELDDALASSKQITVYPNGDANGKPGYSGNGMLGNNYALRSRIGEVVRGQFGGNFQGPVDRTTSLYAKPGSTISATTQSSSFDRGSGADTSDILVRFYVHIFTITASGGNAQWLIGLQESSDDGASDAFAVLLPQIAKSGGETGGFVQEYSSHDLERYVRAQFTLDATSGTLLAQASFFAEPN